MSGNLNEGAIQTDRYDRRTFGRVLEESERIKRAVTEQSVSGLVQDVWASLYKTTPSFREPAPTVNRRVMETLMNQTAWKDLRQTTQMDEYSAAIGSLNLEESIQQAIPEDVKQAA